MSFSMSDAEYGRNASGLKKLQTIIESALDEDAAQFERMQESNKTLIQ